MEDISMQNSTLILSSEEKKAQLTLLCCTMILGVLFNCLFIDKEPGISLPLFVFAFYGVLFINVKKEIEFRFDLSWALFIPIVLLSLTYLFYTNVVFQILNGLVLPVLIVMQTMLVTKTNLFSWNTPGFLIDMFYGFFYRTFYRIFEPFKVLLRLFDKKDDRYSRHLLRKILLGLFISIPLLIILVSLLVSADRIFESYLERIPNIFKDIKLDEYFARGFVIVFISLTSFSYVLSLMNKKKPHGIAMEDGTLKLQKVWDPVVVITVLFLVDIIYLIFVLIQCTYLFGGVNFELPKDFTYSEYARRGFFELLVVTILNLGLLMLFLGFTKINYGFTGRLIRILNSLLVGSTLVMLISAYYRMLLYEEAYGYTYLRVLTQAFMIFLLVIFIIMFFRIWNDRIKLAKPLILIAITAFVIINYVNIDLIIARNNIDRYETTGEIDLAYLSTLSYDVVPVVAKLKESEGGKLDVDFNLFISSKRKEASRRKDWQSFNISVYRARSYLK